MKKIFADTFYWAALLNPKDQWHEAAKDAQRKLRRRLDKGYSLTDCVSMVTMKNLDVREILTHDNHFEQEGLTILL